jgi:WD40 repeat protein
VKKKLFLLETIAFSGGIGTRMTAFETNFYVAGGTLRMDAPSYVDRQADGDLLESLRAGEYCYVLNTRQIGKSSLMVRTATRLREDGVRVAILDLTSLGQNLTAEQWYKGLLGKLAEQMGLDDEIGRFCRDNPGLSPMQKFMEAIYQVILPHTPAAMVLFIDEIDTVRSLPFSADELFAAIRECYNRRAQDPKFSRISFCLLGVASPADLVSDPRVGPFNIGRRVQIRDFTPDEAVPLAEGLKKYAAESVYGNSNLNAAHVLVDDTAAGLFVAPDDNLESGLRLLSSVMYWTGGHPYMTQRLCRAVAEDPGARMPADVDRHCESLFLSSSARGTDDNLAFVRNRLLRSDGDLAGLLYLYRQICAGRNIPEDETNPLKSILLLSGIVRVENGYLKVRNRIYSSVFDRRWVDAHMPDADLRRQRAAYRKGVARTAIFSAAIVAAMALAIINSRRAEFRVSKALGVAKVAEGNERSAKLQAQRLLYNADMALAQRAWEENNAGRVKRLLIAHASSGVTEDWRGFEWGYLWKLTHAAKYTLRGHEQPIRSIAISPDGRSVATGSYDHMVRVWDCTSGTEIHAPLIHSHGVYALSFSPDGKTLASGSGDGKITLWDTFTWRERIIVHGHAKETVSLSYSADGTTLGSGGDDGVVRIWNARTMKPLASLPGHAGFVWGVAFSPNGELLATGGDDRSIRLWKLNLIRQRDGQSIGVRVNSGFATLGDKSSIVKSLAFSPDGSTLAVGRTDNTAQLWNMRSRALVHAFRNHRQLVVTVAFSSDGKRLMTGSFDGTSILWDAKTYAPLKTFKGHDKGIMCAAFSRDGRVLASGSEDSTTKLWETEAPSNPTTIRPGSGVWSVAVTRDGRQLASGNATGTAQVWDPATGICLKTLRGHTGVVRAVAFSRDGQRLATASEDRTAKVWDLASGEAKITFGRFTNKMTSVIFSPDDKLIAMAGDDSIARVYEAGTGRLKFPLKGHTQPVVDLAFSPDGRILATASYDKLVFLWDVATGHKIGELRGHGGEVRCVRFSQDGKYIATASNDNTSIIWDASSLRPRQTLHGHMSLVQCITWSPDAKRVATGSFDNTVKVWDLLTGRETLTLDGHTNSVWALTFTPDGSSLVTSSDDGTIKIWRGASAGEIASLRTQDPKGPIPGG